MPNHILKITTEVAAKKFFLRELLLFFIDKRGQVFADGDFNFSVLEFSQFIQEKELFRVMGQDITYQKIHELLDCCKNKLKKRNRDLDIINPPSPLLKYVVSNRSQAEIKIKDCPTEYLNNALRDIDIALHINDWKETSEERVNENQKTLFEETRDHKLSFLTMTTSSSLSTRERAMFLVLKKKFGHEYGYSDLYDEYLTLERPNSRTLENKTAKYRKDFVNSAIAELRIKMYKISANPRTIETVPGGNSLYRLIY